MTDLEKLHLIVRLSQETNMPVDPSVTKQIKALEDKLIAELHPDEMSVPSLSLLSSERFARPENLLLQKEVDWSVLQYGLTIPLSQHELWYEALGKHVRRGSSINIILITNTHKFSAQLLHTNNVLQVRYSSNSDIAQFFRQAFARSYDFISKKRKKNDNPHIPVHLPEGEQQMLQLFRTDQPRTLFISGIDINKE